MATTADNSNMAEKGSTAPHMRFALPSVEGVLGHFLEEQEQEKEKEQEEEPASHECEQVTAAETKKAQKAEAKAVRQAQKAEKKALKKGMKAAAKAERQCAKRLAREEAAALRTGALSVPPVPAVPAECPVEMEVVAAPEPECELVPELVCDPEPVPEPVPEPEPLPTPAEVVYAEQIAALRAMGFEIDDRMLAALEAHDGDLAKIVNLLLNGDL